MRWLVVNHQLVVDIWSVSYSRWEVWSRWDLVVGYMTSIQTTGISHVRVSFVTPSNSHRTPISYICLFEKNSLPSKNHSFYHVFWWLKTKIQQKKTPVEEFPPPPQTLTNMSPFQLNPFFLTGIFFHVRKFSSPDRSPGTSSVGSGPDFQVPGLSVEGWLEIPVSSYTQGFPNTSRVGGWKHM